MKYRIDTKYVWYNKGKQIVLMYFIQNIPFTYDEVPDDGLYDLSLIDIASGERRWEPEDLYKLSGYLVEEECHPLIFDLELENPEMLPVD
tara:strand:+ start:253 stop:522 length:270 start_codon:yes stop_codon:yes gene_type:complete